MANPLVRRLAQAAAEAGWWSLQFNFRYLGTKADPSRDLSQERDDLLGGVRFARRALAPGPIFVAGKSMGARVCSRASADRDFAGVIALDYPLHPRFRPEVRNPPEWRKLTSPPCSSRESTIRSAISPASRKSDAVCPSRATSP